MGQRRVSNAIAIASLRVHRSQASEAMASSCNMGAQTEILHSHPIDKKFHPGIAELHPKLIHNTPLMLLGLRWDPYEKNLKKIAQVTYHFGIN